MCDEMSANKTSSNICNFEGCNVTATSRCSRCRNVWYCGKSHQTMDWKTHKITCNITNNTSSITSTSEHVHISSSNNSASSNVINDTSTSSSTSRQCRCMFCGEQLTLQSEEDAIAHMSICPSLQEQLNDENQFTIPSCLK